MNETMSAIGWVIGYIGVVMVVTGLIADWYIKRKY